jgi:peroxiredoxin
MRKSENTPAVASRPATKPSKRDAADAMRSATEYLIATRQAERALKAGNCAPTFRLRDHRGVEVASETLLRHRPLLLTSTPPRGARRAAGTCRRSSSSGRQSRRAGRLSISQQTITENAKVLEQLKLGFPILSDQGGRLAQLFGVRWRIPELLRDIHRKSGIDLPLLNGDQGWALPIPARFILDRAGVIAYSEINPGQSGRSPPRDVLPVLDHLRSLRAA